MQNRQLKRLGIMLAVTMALMPLPNMLDAKPAQATPSVSTSVVPAMHTPVNRAGVAVNGVMKAAIDPVKIGDLYYVPFKDIAHILDYHDIRFSSRTKTCTATDGSVTVRVTLGGTRAMKGDEPVTIHPPRQVNGTTYISLDAVSAAFNAFTWFKAENGSIQIQMPARTYKVLEGDTLWKVAMAHHTTIAAVRSANGLKSDQLLVGQKLKLPAEALTREMDPVHATVPTQGYYYDYGDGTADYTGNGAGGGTATPSPTGGGTAAPGAGAGGTATISSTASTKAQAIIQTGKKYMGVPYKFGAKTSDAPRQMDCSSFMQYIFKTQGNSLPRDSRQQSAVGTRVSSLQPGDLMFFKYPERYSDGRVGHVGVYMGNGQILHTIPRTGVTVSKYSGYWQRNFLFAKRVIK
jgi:peptidoglycan DL-endopeptidase LytE